MTGLKISEYGRPIIWRVQSSWYNGQASICCAYSTFHEAVKHAIWCATAFGGMDWSTFPNPARGSYPYEDRDGLESSALTPKFRASWDGQGGGYVEVSRVEVEGEFSAADMTWVDATFDQLFPQANRNKL